MPSPQYRLLVFTSQSQMASLVALVTSKYRSLLNLIFSSAFLFSMIIRSKLITRSNTLNSFSVGVFGYLWYTAMVANTSLTEFKIGNDQQDLNPNLRAKSL